MKKLKLEGIFPALIVSYKENGELDIDGIKQNVKFSMDQGCAGVVVNGSTGEAVNLTREERVAVIKAAKEVIGNGKIIAGTGAPVTRTAIEYTQDAKDAGADAALVITPFNAIPNKQGLIKHYEMVAEVGLPVILYNLPAHTGVEIDIDTFNYLVKNDNIIGIKESSGNFPFMAEVIRKYGDELTIFTGCDDLTLQIFSMGAKACILALANIAPAMVVEMLKDVQANRMAEAREKYYKLIPIAKLISSSENFPAPVKEAVRLLGRPAGAPRMPITPVTREESDQIREALKYAGLL